MSERDPMTIGDGVRLGCGMFLFQLVALFIIFALAALLGV